MLGEGVEAELAVTRRLLEGLDVHASFVGFACRAAPVSPLPALHVVIDRSKCRGYIWQTTPKTPEDPL
jgi:hypothetical protein